MKTALRFALLAAILSSAAVASGVEVPFLTGRVTDNAEILSPGARGSLTALLKGHEDRTGNQIAVLTVTTLAGENIEEYAVAVFAEWKLGKKGKDNGILFVVAPKDRRMRIEVGYGLEGALTDSRAGAIIRDVMTPRFKAGDYDGGVEAGVKAVIDVLEKGDAAVAGTNEDRGAPASSGFRIDAPDLSIPERILVGAFVFGIIGLFTVIGVMTPGVGWFLYLFLIPFWAMFPILVVGATGALYLLGTYLVVFPAAKLLIGRTAWYGRAKKELRTKGHASIGGFSIASGGSGGSSNSGGSGFSGGGGGSGGGGASGGW